MAILQIMIVIALLIETRNKARSKSNKEKILADLNEYLTEDRDRKLFDLPSLKNN